TAATRAAAAESARSTAIAQSDSAAAAQESADANLATAQADLQAGSTAQAAALAAATQSVAQANIAATRGSEMAVTVTAVSESAQQTLSALQAGSQQAADERATLQAQIDSQATAQTGFDSVVATLTAQVDLAAFAREVAEQDRAVALEQVWGISTQAAVARRELATAQAQLTGLPPATATLPPTATPQPQPQATPLPTEAASAGLGATFEASTGLYRVNYPATWVAVEPEPGVIVITNDESLIGRGNMTFTTGQYEINILIAAAEDLGVTPDVSLEEYIGSLVMYFKSQSSAFSVGEPASIRLEKNNLLRVSGTDGLNDFTLNVMDLGEGMLSVIFSYAAPGDGQSLTPILDAMLDTLDYGALQAS
ncbi:MAG: hypothetical protein JNJ78_18045, partial [Anaerolineae bacterium]|nr:hypothetical protein [Anaerolineae bacterium]